LVLSDRLSQREDNLNRSVHLHRLPIERRRRYFHSFTALIADAIRSGDPETYCSFSTEPSLAMIA
jgi:hypothetical protein